MNFMVIALKSIFPIKINQCWYNSCENIDNSRVKCPGLGCSGDMDGWVWFTCLLSFTTYSAPPAACHELAQLFLISNHHYLTSGFCTSKGVEFLH